MKTIRQVTITPVFVEWMPDFYEPNTVYISKEHGCSKHLCICGCGHMTIMPLDDGTKWWKLVESDKGVSFIGSVGNYAFPCKSHYIITNNVANFV